MGIKWWFQWTGNMKQRRKLQGLGVTNTRSSSTLNMNQVLKCMSTNATLASVDSIWFNMDCYQHDFFNLLLKSCSLVCFCDYQFLLILYKLWTFILNAQLVVFSLHYQAPLEIQTFLVYWDCMFLWSPSFYEQKAQSKQYLKRKISMTIFISINFCSCHQS